MWPFMMSTPPQLTKEEELSVLSHEVTLKTLSDNWKAGKYNKIVVCMGAGVSVSAGIPDFRTPGTGLYDNLQKFNLPRPELIFTLDYFKENPEPFYELSKAMYPGNFKPTPTHYFIRLLQERGQLLRCYTQNVDTLERMAGIDPEKLVEAHGSFADSACIQCKAPYSLEWVKERIFRDEIPRCASCEGLVKPSIVFFGEPLPRRFFDLRDHDCRDADLMLVLGTSLKVQPFAGLKDQLHPRAPRLLLNRELVGQRCNPQGLGFRHDSVDNYRDVALLQDCDSGVMLLAHLLGLEDDLCALLELHEGPTPPPIPEPQAVHTAAHKEWRAPAKPLPPLRPFTKRHALKDDEDWRCDIIAPYYLGSLRVGGYLAVEIHKPHVEDEEEEEKNEEGWLDQGRDYVTLTRAGEVSPHAYDDFNFLSDDGDAEVILKVPFKHADVYEVWYVAKGEVAARFGPLDLKAWGR